MGDPDEKLIEEGTVADATTELLEELGIQNLDVINASPKSNEPEPVNHAICW